MIEQEPKYAPEGQPELLLKYKKDMTELVPMWIAEEKAWFYFKPDATPEFIQERLEKYRMRRRIYGSSN